MQVPGAIGLGGEDALQLSRGQALDRGIVDEAGGVHHRAQRLRLGNRVEQLDQLPAIGDVAGGDPRLGAKPFQLRSQLPCPRSLGAAAADQEQVAGAVLGDQVAGEKTAEAAAAAADQHRLPGVEGTAPFLRLGGGGGQSRCPRRQRHAVAQGELGLLGEGERGAKRLGRGLGAVAVDQGEAAGMLGLGRAQQAPDRGRREVG